MDTMTKAERAKKVYDTLCASIENRGWHFGKDEENLAVYFGVSGEDLPMQFVIFVDVDRQIVRLDSRFPFKFREDKRLDGAIATCYATDKLMDGSFDYNVTTGVASFRMTESFLDSEIGEELFSYMMDCSASTVDEFNDKFLAINLGLIDVQDFING